MTDIYEITSELASLWPALAAALARDTAGTDIGGTATWTSATLVNADVLAAMMTLRIEIPGAYGRACELLGERHQPRDVGPCLLALPRLASRMDTTGHLREATVLARQAAGWLRVTKRALGLRRPDIPLGYPCPQAETQPDDHQEACMLYAAGDEGFLRATADGMRVEWVATSRIYCASPECGAAWGPELWLHLGRLLKVPLAAAS